MKQLPIILPPIMQMKTESGIYTLFAGRHDTRGSWDTLASNSFDIELSGVKMASIYNQPSSYPGKLSVSMNSIRWLGSLSTDHLDNRWHDFVHDNNDLSAAFVATVKRCERLHQLRGGWNPRFHVSWGSDVAPRNGHTGAYLTSRDEAWKAAVALNEQFPARSHQPSFVCGYAHSNQDERLFKAAAF